MTDATHIPQVRRTARHGIGTILSFLAKLAELDPTRRQLSHLSAMSDAQVDASGTTRAALVRQIIGPREML